MPACWLHGGLHYRGRVLDRERKVIRDPRTATQGLAISAIARRTDLNRKTVRKHLAQGLQTLRYGPRTPRPQLLDPYRAYLRDRIEEYPLLRATRLLREIRELGYPGGDSQLTRYLREWTGPLMGNVNAEVIFPSCRGNFAGP